MKKWFKLGFIFLDMRNFNSNKSPQPTTSKLIYNFEYLFNFSFRICFNNV